MAAMCNAVTVCDPLAGRRVDDAKCSAATKIAPGQVRVKLRRQDSNLNSQNQNLMCCRLHHDGPRISGEPIGRRRPAAHTDAFVRL